MSPTELEQMLWEMAQNDEPGAMPPADDLLRAYRDGRLEEGESRAMEAALGNSQKARRRLVELSGISLDVPPPRLREEILRHRPLGRQKTSRRLPRPRWLAAAAALLAMILAWPTLRTPSLPPDLAYDVTVTGLASTRSSPEAGGEVEALPETRLRITVEAVARAESEVEIALYRRSGSRLERIEPGGQLQMQMSRGAGLFEAQAADLVGRGAGLHELVVVVGRSGDLPATLTLGPPESPYATVTQGDRRRVYPQQVFMRSLYDEDSLKEEVP